MQTLFHPAGSRGYATYSGLDAHYSFSFANHYDPERMGFGALRVLNDDVIAPEQGFGRHHHNDMEIITIPLSGALAHEDSMGNKAVIKTGEIQVMSAGTGVEHSEFNASRTETANTLQIWILPSERGVRPRYDQKLFDHSMFENTFALVVGPAGSEPEGALFIHQDAFLSLVRSDVDQAIEYVPRRENNGVYFFVIEGEAEIADQRLGKRDALGVWETEKISIQIQTKKDAFVLAIEVPMK